MVGPRWPVKAFSAEMPELAGCVFVSIIYRFRRAFSNMWKLFQKLNDSIRRFCGQDPGQEELVRELFLVNAVVGECLDLTTVQANETSNPT